MISLISDRIVCMLDNDGFDIKWSCLNLAWCAAQDPDLHPGSSYLPDFNHCEFVKYSTTPHSCSTDAVRTESKVK